MPRDLFLRPVPCRNGGENEKALSVLINEIILLNNFSALKWCRDLRSNGFITAIIDRQKSNAVISIEVILSKVLFLI
jgi:hypothetical protein